MNPGHVEGAQSDSPRPAPVLLRLAAAQWLCDPVNHGLLNGVTDLASLFRDNHDILFCACEGETERAVVVSRPCPASSVFAHANTGGVPA